MVSYIYDRQSSFPFGAQAKVAYEVGHVGNLARLILHGTLIVNHNADRHAVAVAHKGVGASYWYAANGA